MCPLEVSVCDWLVWFFGRGPHGKTKLLIYGQESKHRQKTRILCCPQRSDCQWPKDPHRCHGMGRWTFEWQPRYKLQHWTSILILLHCWFPAPSFPPPLICEHIPRFVQITQENVALESSLLIQPQEWTLFVVLFNSAFWDGDYQSLCLTSMTENTSLWADCTPNLAPLLLSNWKFNLTSFKMEISGWRDRTRQTRILVMQRTQVQLSAPVWQAAHKYLPLQFLGI